MFWKQEHFQKDTHIVGIFIVNIISANIKGLLTMVIVIGYAMNMLCMEIKLAKVPNYMKKN